MDGSEPSATEQAWSAVLAVARGSGAGAEAPLGRPDGWLDLLPDGRWESRRPLAAEAASLCDLYLPILAAAAGRPYAVAHLGQSLDGRIATAGGASHWVTGEADVTHNHRMRALADAVLVGAGTVRCDDPRLTVRRCQGRNPVRVVIDTERRLGTEYGVFRDGAAPTLLLCAADRTRPGERHGEAEVIGLPRASGPSTGPGPGLCPETLRAALAERGLRFLFIEGGGITVSRFLNAGSLDRLQITVAPLILGSGRPAITLPEVETVDGGLRPPTRRFVLGQDVLFDCILRA